MSHSGNNEIAEAKFEAELEEDPGQATVESLQNIVDDLDVLYKRLERLLGKG